MIQNCTRVRRSVPLRPSNRDAETLFIKPLGIVLENGGRFQRKAGGRSPDI